MKRKDYQKPTTKVVQLQHRAQLLQASPVENVGVQKYNWNSETEE